jgi:hypothetical protein
VCRPGASRLVAPLLVLLGILLQFTNRICTIWADKRQRQQRLGFRQCAYTLTYRLINGGEPPNSWRAIISSVDEFSVPLVLDAFYDSSVFDDPISRSIPFALPDGTSAVKLTFEARQVRQRHLNSAPLKKKSIPLESSVHSYLSRGCGSNGGEVCARPNNRKGNVNWLKSSAGDN